MLSRLPPATLLALVLAAVFGRLSTALAQIVAAIYLSPTDFGIYATAMGAVLLSTGLRGGGTGNHLQTMTPEEFESSGWRIFRYQQTFVLIGVCATLAIAWPVSAIYADAKHYAVDQLLWTVLVLGVNFILFNGSWYGRCRLVAHGGVRTLSALDAVLGVIKFVATWVLAAKGFGPLALAGGITVGNATELLWIWLRSGMPVSEFRGRGPWLPETFREMRLPLVMAILTTLGSQTDSAVGSLFLPVSVLGYYYWAMQLASQPTMLVGSSIRAVFTSASASTRGDPLKERMALQAVFNGAMVFLPIVTMLLPATFDSFERAVWGGRWAQASWPVWILSVAAIYSTALQLAGAPVAGVRKWGVAIRLDVLRAGSKIFGAIVGGVAVLWLDLEAVSAGIIMAAAIGGISAIVAAAELWRLMESSGLSRGSTVYELYSTPLAALLSAVASSGLAHSISEPLRIGMGDRLAAGVECGLATSLYALLAFLLLRFGYTPTLERLMQAVPAAVARQMRKVFFLPGG